MMLAHSLLACAVCAGDPSSDQVRAAKLGVAVLLAVVVALLAAVALVARRWARRAWELEAAAERMTTPPGFIKPATFLGDPG